MAPREPPVLTIPTQPPGAPHTLPMTQDPISVLWGHESLPKWCRSSAGPQLPTAVPFPDMSPIDPGPSMGQCPSLSPLPRRWLVVWTLGWTWLRSLDLSYSLAGVLWVWALAIKLEWHSNSQQAFNFLLLAQAQHQHTMHLLVFIFCTYHLFLSKCSSTQEDLTSFMIHQLVKA